MKKNVIIALMVLFTFVAKAQTADEIINKYIENTGGKDKWTALKSIKIIGKANQQGMEFPFVSLQTSTGKQKNAFTFQGKEIVQPAFDGKEGWQTNFMTMKAEKMESEDAENMQRAAGDFPDPFLDYKAKGYSVVLEGKETVEGTECFKIKLIRKPMKVDGKEEENSSHYFFDTQNYVPIVVKTPIKKGQAKGAISETVMSDYQEVNGLYFPFSIAQKFQGQVVITLTTEKVELNAVIDDKEFTFPTDK